MNSILQYNLPEISNFLLSQKTIAICLPEDATHDNWCAGLALVDALQNGGVEVRVYCPSDFPKALRFLPYSPTLEVKSEFEKAGLTLTVPKKDGDNIKVNFEHFANETKIFIESENFELKTSSLKIESTLEKIDAFVCIGVVNLSKLGELFSAKPDLFYTRPIINIDNSIQNQSFGTENLINVRTHSLSEWIFQILTDGKNFIFTSNAATILFAGLAILTDSFGQPGTSPAILRTAGELLEYGANHQAVVQNIFKTKTLSEVKLWGKLLTQVKIIGGAGWIKLDQSGFKETGAVIKEIPLALRNLLEQTEMFYSAGVVLALENGNSLITVVSKGGHVFDYFTSTLGLSNTDPKKILGTYFHKTYELETSPEQFYANLIQSANKTDSSN